MSVAPVVSPESHRLVTTRIESESASKARKALIAKYGELFSGKCSCGHWRVEIGTRLQLRQVHDIHVQDMLGPDAQREEGDRG